MGKTKIQWATDTWNPIRGCSKVSAGCTNCYAEKMAARFSGPGQPYEGLATRGPARWTGKLMLVEKHLRDPIRWKRPRVIFVNSMSDMFHESLSNETIAKVFRVICEANHGPVEQRHTYQILTKRAERMVDWFKWAQEHESGWFHPHTGLLDLGRVWMGVSCEDQRTADERIPHLIETPAAVRFVSAEPLLGMIDLDAWLPGSNHLAEHRRPTCDACGEIMGRVWNPGDKFQHYSCACCDHIQRGPGLDWVIVGGESGPGARRCEVSAVREIVLQCETGGTACFVKQLGSHPVTYGSDAFAEFHPWDNGHRPKLRHAKGGDPAEWPEDLRVQQWPATAEETP